MAKLWISIVAVCFCVVKISSGHEPDLTNPPLLNYGPVQAGDKEVDNFNKEQIPLDFNITYFGSSYYAIYVSKDGIIGFVENIQYIPKVTWSEGISNKDADGPFIGPFYHNGYDPVAGDPGSYQGKIYYRTIYASKMDTEEAKKSHHHDEDKELLEYFNEYVQEAVINAPSEFSTEVAVIITWVDVTDKDTEQEGDCDAHDAGSQCKSATFQVAIIADKDNTFAMFNYLKMDVPYQATYQAGFNGGYERGWFNVIPCLAGCDVSSGANSSSGTSQLNNLPHLNGSDFRGRYFMNVGGETVVRGGCLPTNITAGLLEVYPRELGMLGGEKLEVSGKCLKAGSKIYCRFGEGDNEYVTEGVMTNDMKGFCPAPLMTIRGSVKLSWSSDGQEWSATKDITVVVPWMVDDVNPQDSLLPWYQRDASSFTIEWSSDALSSNTDARVQVKLIGYREEGRVEFKELETLGEARNSDGTFTFQTKQHACRKNCEDFQMGLLEVGLLPEYFEDASNRVAVRYGPVPLGWYVNEKLSDSMGKDWSKQMCRKWYGEELEKDQGWLEDLPKCPCSLDQALSDFGRWQAHPGCDLFNEGPCPIYKSKHCVRSIQPTESDAGNLCCYHVDGTLMYTQLAFRGGSPIKKHPLGVHPYNTPGKVPTMSYMKSDVIPYVHCCHWMEDDGDLCHHYTKMRPTTGCQEYDVPGLAFVRGDAHITTFDGSTYEFGGFGDFWLMELPKISIQGRFEPRRGSWDLGSLAQQAKWKPTALTHVTIQGSGVPIQVYPAPDNSLRRRGLDILVGNERHFFYKKSTKWQEYGGEVIINNAITMTDNPHNNFTIITNNVGINIVGLNNLLQVTVALPPSMKNQDSTLKGVGLLGTYDGNPDNDFVSKSNVQETLQANETKEFFDNFAMSWAVESHESLFLLEKDANRHKDYLQYSSYEDIPHDFDSSPSQSEINSTCDDDMLCKWDFRITGSEKVATATKDANELFSYLQISSNKESEEDKRKSITDSSTDSGTSTGMVAGIVIGVVVALIIILAVIVFVMNKRKGGSRDVSTKEQDAAEGTNEPMMEADKKDKAAASSAV